jgi:hypothetical protein
VHEGTRKVTGFPSLFWGQPELSPRLALSLCPLPYFFISWAPLSTGGLNFHSIHDFIPVRSLEKMVEVLRNLVTL